MATDKVFRNNKSNPQGTYLLKTTNHRVVTSCRLKQTALKEKMRLEKELKEKVKIIKV